MLLWFALTLYLLALFNKTGCASGVRSIILSAFRFQLRSSCITFVLTMTEKKNEGRSAERVYYNKLTPERADALYILILQKLTEEKLYRDSGYTAARLAEELGTNTRYISAAVALCSGGNYPALVNSLRLRDACRMLRSPRCAAMTAEEIGLLAGFASRQAFYIAFARVHGCTPKEYRKQSTHRL